MKILTARALGFCFGVRDALAEALRQPEPADVTIHGELVHNERVRTALRTRGFRERDERERAGAPPQTGTVLITAHGVSDRERARLRATGAALVDTTCPLVARAHRAARRLADQGFHVVVVGRREHVEVRGLVGDLDRYDVVEDEADVRTWAADRIGVVCQTTTRQDHAARVLAAIEAANPQATVRSVDTICEPTKQRVAAAQELAEQADLVVVVGGRGSNNTRQLVELCAARGARAVHVQAAADLDPAWFDGVEVVGLTAGTSTPDEVIDEVRAALFALAGVPGSGPPDAARG